MRRITISLQQAAIALVASYSSISCTSGDAPFTPIVFDGGELDSAIPTTSDGGRADTSTATGHDAAADVAKVDATQPETSVDAGTDAQGDEQADAALACSGWVTETPGNCTHNSAGPGLCTASCVAGTHFLTADCKDGSCDCKSDGDTKCTCTLPDGGAATGPVDLFEAGLDGFTDPFDGPVGGSCQTCCPGMN